MGHREIPTSAVEAGAAASSYVLRALRDNQRAADHYRQSVAAQLDDSTGHAHGQGVTKSTTYTFADAITVAAGVNDRLDFRFGGGSVAAADVTATLDAGTRTPTAHAAHVQAKMRAAASATTEISCTYDSSPASETRGLFTLRHTGSSDSPNTRVLSLLFGSGSNVTRSAAPSMGFAKVDRKRAFGYLGDSGFSDGFTENIVTVGDGDLLLTEDFQNDAFETAKFADGVATGPKFQSGSVDGSKMQNGAATGAKVGPPSTVSTASIASGATRTFTFVQPNGGSGRTPIVTAYTTTAGGCPPGGLSVTSITHTSGNSWDVDVKNETAGSLTVGLSGI